MGNEPPEFEQEEVDSQPSVTIDLTPEFYRNLRDLDKRYRHVRADIQTVIQDLEVGNFVGDRIGSIPPFKIPKEKIISIAAALDLACAGIIIYQNNKKWDAPDRISGIGEGYVMLKVRIKNRDIHKGKSSGYRLIYQVESPTSVLLLTIYSKSDRSDITAAELRSIAAEFQDDDYLR
jgi:mRNA-degrading endonuclease RelE of RelBE toxin-antitoxin system